MSTPVTPNLDNLGSEGEIGELREALRRARQQLAKRAAQTADLIEAVHQGAKDAAIALGPLSPVPAPAKDRRKGRDEAALWHTTDWQLGKRTDSYNTEVALSRLDRFVDKAIRLTQIQRQDHPVRHCTIAMGGDMLENTTTFPGQAYLVDSSIFDQLANVVRAGRTMVRRALAEYESVTLVGEPGNHGRIGRKGEVAAGDNWDRIAYHQIAEPFRNDARFQFVQADRWHQRIEIGAYRAMLIHGDEVKGFGGQTPAYALMRKGNAWASGAARWQFADIYVGHYHQPMQLTLANGNQLYMTGSTESDNTFAQEFVAATSVPSQRVHFVDPEKGRVTAQYVVWLDD
jgi:hypothetical protein